MGEEIHLIMQSVQPSMPIRKTADWWLQQLGTRISTRRSSFHEDVAARSVLPLLIKAVLVLDFQISEARSMLPLHE